jgi:hypothetical protein
MGQFAGIGVVTQSITHEKSPVKKKEKKKKRIKPKDKKTKEVNPFATSAPPKNQS